MKIKVELDIDQKLVEDVLVSGFEGGTGYWLKIRNDLTPMKQNYPKQIFETGLMVQDQDTGRKVLLTQKRMEKAVKLMAQKSPKHFGDMLDENFDAETGDVLLQYAVNGKLLYG